MNDDGEKKNDEKRSKKTKNEMKRNSKEKGKVETPNKMSKRRSNKQT
jgi:hypothetical protein